MNRNFKIIFKYSLAQKIKTKSFLAFSIILAILSIGATLINPLMNKFDSPKQLNVAVYQNKSYESSLTAFSNENNLNYNVSVTDNKKDPKDDIIIDVDNDSVYSSEDLSDTDKNYINLYFKQIQILNIASKNNIPTSVLQSLNKPVNITYSYAKDVKQFDYRLYLINMVVVILSYIFLVMGMQYIGQEILEEKSSRAMEIIITNIDSKSHMNAKVLSNIVYLFVFIFEILIFSLVGMSIGNAILEKPIFDYINSLKSMFSGINTNQLISFTLIIILLFIITIVTVLQLSAIISSTVSITEDFQKAIMPLMMLLIFGYIIGLSIQSTNLLNIVALIPVFNFYVIPGLILKGSISTITIIISVILSLGFMVLINIYGTKIYRFGVLNYSSQSSMTIIKQALKSK